MRPIFWVTALAVLSLSSAKNSTEKTKPKPKRQLDSIRTPANFQYSLVLPHSKVAHFRALGSTRRISGVATRGGKLPPYAVQMEPVVQYSQKDPLYDRNLENLDDTVVNKNEIYAQPKILNVNDQYAESTYDPPYGSLPTAPLYGHEPQHYYDAPEPIIEIIIKESNESLPAPPPVSIPVQKKKKEPVQVFYVKYSKDPHLKDKVVYEKPIPAITPASNDEDDHHEEEYITVTPEPYYINPPSTTLRAIIKPESEVYHSDNGVKITFGNEESGHYSDRREGSFQQSSEDHEETAPQPAIALPHDPPPTQDTSIEQGRSISSNIPAFESYRPISPTTQGRFQFQQPPLPAEQQLPKAGIPIQPFRTQTHSPRPSNSFGPNPTVNSFSNFPNGPGPHFGNNVPSGPNNHNAPIFPTNFPRQNVPTFRPRPNNSPPFAPRPHFTGPSRSSFHSGPQRPFPSQPQPFFDEPKYLQENYHTITTEQINDSQKPQQLPGRQTQNYEFLQKPSPSPSPAQFLEQRNRPHLPLHQQLPQQRPPQQFTENTSPSSNRSPFYNLKPSPPLIENIRPPFQSQSPSQPPFSFHQGPLPSQRPSIQIPIPHNKPSFPGPISPSPSPSATPQHHFLPQPSSPTLFNFHSQPSPSERPQFQQSHNLPERPLNINQEHHQNVSPFVPNGGELVPAISKYEQHITVSGSAAPDYSGLSGSNSSHQKYTPSIDEQYRQNQQQQQYLQNQQKQYQEQQRQYQQEQQQKSYDAEQEQVKYQLAQNVKKQQEEIQRLQAQLQFSQHQQQRQEQQQEQQQQQQQHQQQQQQLQQQAHEYEAQNYNQLRNFYSQQAPGHQSSPLQTQERSRLPTNYVTSSTSSPPYYQTTSRTIEIKPTTQKYVSSTLNSISPTESAKKEEKKKPAVELPDEVPEDLRQQLLSSGILDHADISVLDYDKVGETPLDSLPPDQLANFFSAGGGQQLSSSEHKPVVVKPNGDRIESRIDQNVDDDQEFAASENVPSFVVPPPTPKQAVEMKVVHFDPKSEEGKNIAKDYVKQDATQLDPVALNDKKYNRYLPLKVSGNQFPLPDVLKGRKITSVVVLAPVETELLNDAHSRSERAANSNNLKGIKFVAGDSLQELLKRPTKKNFENWLETEKKTASDLQSVVLLVLGDDDQSNEKEIFMYDITSGNVNKLSGELSNAFVEAAENNSLSKDIGKLAIEGDGTPENFQKAIDDNAEASENVPFLVDLSGLRLDHDQSNQVLITSGYSKTKLGRSLRRNH